MNTVTGARPVTVADYAAQVRAHLVGMSPEQVDDLTDGLEADLADALADAGGTAPADPVGQPDVLARFGPPAEYARELRGAAGLPEPDAVPRTGGLRAALSRARARWRRWQERAVARLEERPWWPGVRDLGLSVRPLWWLLRAWVVYQLLMQTFTRGWGRGGWTPANVPTFLLFVGVLLVSVQWGRGLWAPRRLPLLVRAVSVGAMILAYPALVWAANASAPVTYYSENEYVPQDGVWVDGMQVSNLFVYDAEGNPLSGVQVFDDRGRAVRTVTDSWMSWSLPGVQAPWMFVPAADEDGRDRWNVYPLLGAPEEDFDAAAWGNRQEPWETLRTEPRTPPLPFAKAPALVEREAADDTDATQQTPGDGPTTSATPAPAEEPGDGPTDASAQDAVPDPEGAVPADPAATSAP